MVKTVSRELESVLVEQNHCHGLKAVMSSYMICKPVSRDIHYLLRSSRKNIPW